MGLLNLKIPLGSLESDMPKYDISLDYVAEKWNRYDSLFISCISIPITFIINMSKSKNDLIYGRVIPFPF